MGRSDIVGGLGLIINEKLGLVVDNVGDLNPTGEGGGTRDLRKVEQLAHRQQVEVYLHPLSVVGEDGLDFSWDGLASGVTKERRSRGIGVGG